MNILSWEIYWLSIIENISIWSCLIGIFSFVLAAAAWGYFSFQISDNEYRTVSPEIREPLEISKKKYVRRFVIIGFIGTFISIWLPNSNTIKLIIASEVGDRVLHNSGLIDPSLEYLKAWLEKNTKELKK